MVKITDGLPTLPDGSKELTNHRLLRAFTLATYVAMVGINYLAVALPLGGRDTGAISDSYPNLFAPAGFTFAIWGVIYTLLGVYVIYQLRRGADALAARVNRVFIINALLNGAWMFAWHYELIWLSALIMLGLLLTLIRIANILHGSVLSGQERWLVRLPFSVYFGWITVATIANLTVLLVSLRWNGFGLSEGTWTVIVLLIGALIGSWRMLRDRAIAYGLVLIWAYGGIIAKHLSASGYAGQYQAVIAAVVLCLMAFAGTILFLSTRKSVGGLAY